MKKIEAIVSPYKVDEILQGLERLGVKGARMSEIKIPDSQTGPTICYRGTEFRVGFRSKVKLEVFAPESLLSVTVSSILAVDPTVRLGQGDLLMTSVEEIVDARQEVAKA